MKAGDHMTKDAFRTLTLYIILLISVGLGWSVKLGTGETALGAATFSFTLLLFMALILIREALEDILEQIKRK